MKLNVKLKQMKENLKVFAKKSFGKGILTTAVIGSALSLICWLTISSTSFLLFSLYMATVFASSISLLVSLFGIEKIKSGDIEESTDILIGSLKMIGLGFLVLFINHYFDFKSSLVNYLDFIVLFTGMSGIQLFVDKDYENKMRKIHAEEAQEEKRQMEKLPLRLSLKEEEQELGLTSYFNK